MSFPATAYTVLISSPSDMKKNRELIRQTIFEWNTEFAEDHQVVLIPRMWERDSTPSVGRSPQTIVNEQLVDKADLMIAAFWTRLGTPTETAASGTVEELTRFVESGNGERVILYFSSMAVKPHEINHDQAQKVEDFRKSMEDKCLASQFGSAKALKDQLRRHLTDKVRMLKEDAVKGPGLASLQEPLSLQTRDLEPRGEFQSALHEVMNANSDGYWLSVILDWETRFLPFDSRLKRQQREWAEGFYRQLHAGRRPIPQRITWEPRLQRDYVGLTIPEDQTRDFAFQCFGNGLLITKHRKDQPEISLHWILSHIRYLRDAIALFPIPLLQPQPIRRIGFALSNWPDGGIQTSPLFACVASRQNLTGETVAYEARLTDNTKRMWDQAAKGFVAEILERGSYLDWEEPLERVTLDSVTIIDLI